MKNEKKDHALNEEILQKEVYDSLKYYGLLFPENAKDVDRFEEFYGTTEIETPPGDLLLGKNKGIVGAMNIDEGLSMAAYAPEETGLFPIDDLHKGEKEEGNNEAETGEETPKE